MTLDVVATGHSASPDETERIGERLASGLRRGDVITIRGPLGAGKTRLVAGIARGLGAAGRVKSPTFTLVHEHDGSLPLFHADLYRLEAGESGGLGLEELADRGVVVVEWGERLPAGLREEALEITITIVSERERRFEARGLGARGVELRDAFGRAAAVTS